MTFESDAAAGTSACYDQVLSPKHPRLMRANEEGRGRAGVKRPIDGLTPTRVRLFFARFFRTRHHALFAISFLSLSAVRLKMYEYAESTVMSILKDVALDQQSRRQDSLQRFCVTYTQPLIQYLVRSKRLAEDDAYDLVQDFWHAKMLEPAPADNLVAKFLVARQSHPESSFRRYLFVSVTNFLRSRYRSCEQSIRRSQVSLEQLGGFDAASSEDFDRFDFAWSNHVLVMVLDRVRDACEEPRLRLKWTVFCQLILQPYASDAPRPSYAALAADLGLDNPKEISTALTTFRRLFMRQLEMVVQDYFPVHAGDQDRKSVEREIASILNSLSEKGGLQLPLERWGVESSGTDDVIGLALNNLAVSNLIQGEQDHRTAWSNLLDVDLLNALDVPGTSCDRVTIRAMITGKIADLHVLDQIRAAAKQLGSNQTAHGGSVLCLNRNLYGLTYLLAIVAAKLFLNQDLSMQDPSRLKLLAHSFAEKAWVDDETKEILKRFQSSC
jgi:hypothetical protein